jgi:hypothetical protein
MAHLVLGVATDAVLDVLDVVGARSGSAPYPSSSR